MPPSAARQLPPLTRAPRTALKLRAVRTKEDGTVEELPLDASLDEARASCATHAFKLVAWRRLPARAGGARVQSLSRRSRNGLLAARCGGHGALFAPGARMLAPSATLSAGYLTRPAHRCAQIAVVLGPGLSLYFRALWTLAATFAGLMATCVPHGPFPSSQRQT